MDNKKAPPILPITFTTTSSSTTTTRAIVPMDRIISFFRRAPAPPPLWLVPAAGTRSDEDQFRIDFEYQKNDHALKMEAYSFVLSFTSLVVRLILVSMAIYHAAPLAATAMKSFSGTTSTFVMVPQMDTAAVDALLVDFTDKEIKLLAVAYLSSASSYKFVSDITANSTGNTTESFGKMWSPVKSKAVEDYASGVFERQAHIAAATTMLKMKRKLDYEFPENVECAAEDLAPPSAADDSEVDESDFKKAVKKEESGSEEDSVEGSDGLGEFSVI